MKIFLINRKIPVLPLMQILQIKITLGLKQSVYTQRGTMCVKPERDNLDKRQLWKIGMSILDK